MGFGAQVVSAEWARAQPPWPTCVSRSSDTPPYQGGEFEIQMQHPRALLPTNFLKEEPLPRALLPTALRHEQLGPISVTFTGRTGTQGIAKGADKKLSVSKYYFYGIHMQPS